MKQDTQSDIAIVIGSNPPKPKKRDKKKPKNINISLTYSHLREWEY